MVWARVSHFSLQPTSVKQLYGKPSVQLQSTQAEVNTDILIAFNSVYKDGNKPVSVPCLHLYNCFVIQVGIYFFSLFVWELAQPAV